MNFFILLSILITLFCNVMTYDFPESKKKILDSLINIQMNQTNLHTLGLIIVNHNSTLHKKIYGDDKTTIKTPFLLGSVSKSFTALALLHLNNFSFNDTLDKFGLENYIDEKDAKDITLGELINHTSGLDSLSSKRLFKKGEFHYSNYGYSLLGKIIEKITGENYQDFMRKNIFEPLKMNNTYAIYHKEIIDSYDNFLGFRTKYKGIESEIGDGFYIPAGYISSSIDDMGNYLQYYLDPKNDEYVSKIGKGTIDIGYNLKYGMGMMIQNKSGQIIYNHNGATNSFLSLMGIYPKNDLAFFIVTNTRDGYCSDTTQQIMSNIERFLLYDSYESINSGVIFYTHFTLDVIIFVSISLPLIYLIISIVRKFKKRKYSWFIGIKGIIIFIIDIFILILYPFIAIIFFYCYNSNIRYLAENSKDMKFFIWSTFVVTISTFILKLIYVFIYNKYFKKYEDINPKDVDKEVDYIKVDD